jgi:formamidopyrimidine-DNA glycosylase
VPELPEVETVRRQLARSLVGKRVALVEKVEPAMLRDCTEGQVREFLPGSRIEGVERLGKFLVLPLSETRFLTLHLGMTGNILVSAEPPETWGSHARFVLHMDDEAGHRSVLEFRDMRKFGRLHLTVGAPAPRLENLGPDAWQGTWDTRYLGDRLRGRTAPLKAFLLDQRNLAGIGNIYADEILWWTRLSPLRQAGTLGPAEVAELAAEIPLRLGEGVRFLGCSISDFVDTEGRFGSFQEWLRAYGKQGEECSRCGAVLARVVVAGRGTAYCPGCQR